MGRAHLVGPKLPISVTMWSGEPDSNDVLQKTYGVDHVLYDSELEGLLDGLAMAADGSLELHTLDYGFAGAQNALPPKHRNTLVKGKMDWALYETRLIKSEAEVGLLREANRLSCLAHAKLMRAAKKRTHKTEHELSALFLYETTKRGSFHQACGLKRGEISLSGSDFLTLDFLTFQRPPDLRLRLPCCRLALYQKRRSFPGRSAEPGADRRGVRALLLRERRHPHLARGWKVPRVG